MKDCGDYPFVPAKWFAQVDPSAPRTPRVIVIHDMEAPEKGETAENIAAYFRDDPDHRKASAHLCVDNNSIVRGVHDCDVAYAAPGCNRDGLQLELAGYGNQSREAWEDQYGDDMMALAANAVAAWCLAYNIPAVRLTNDELRAGKRGIVGHGQVSAVYRKSDHTDPGPNFPWDDFLSWVQQAVANG